MTRHQRSVRQLSICLLSLAIAFQGLCHWPVSTDFFTSPQFLLQAFHLELGQTLTWPLPAITPQAPLPVIAVTPPALEAEPPVVSQPPTPFTQSECDAIKMCGTCTYEVDKMALLQQPLDLPIDGTEPRVLIIHTHTSEAYAQTVGFEYEERETARTQDALCNVVRVGDALADVLIDGGVAVIHDTTIHDYPSYNNSYSNTLKSIEAWLAKYPSISMVLDIHRDAVEDASGLPISYTTQVDGTETAQIMLVSGTDQGGLPNPNWRENLAFALQLQATLNRETPGLCRPLNLRSERFNLHATTGSLLIEIGSHGNTLPQALAAAKPLGEGILRLLSE